MQFLDCVERRSDTGDRRVVLIGLRCRQCRIVLGIQIGQLGQIEIGERLLKEIHADSQPQLGKETGKWAGRNGRTVRGGRRDAGRGVVSISNNVSSWSTRRQVLGRKPADASKNSNQKQPRISHFIVLSYLVRMNQFNRLPERSTAKPLTSNRQAGGLPA